MAGARAPLLMCSNRGTSIVAVNVAIHAVGCHEMVITVKKSISMIPLSSD